MEWILASDKLPEESVEVIATIKHWKSGKIKTLVTRLLDYNLWEGYGRANAELVYWLPLPKNPHKENKVD